jgi:hypothetical protein
MSDGSGIRANLLSLKPQAIIKWHSPLCTNQDFCNGIGLPENRTLSRNASARRGAIVTQGLVARTEAGNISWRQRKREGILMNGTAFELIDEVVGAGRLVASCDNETMLALVKTAILNDFTASFYLTREQSKQITDWYFTPERVELAGLKEISSEELEKIKALGVEHITNFRYSPTECTCGHVYGALEFFQQGIREHGLEMVNAVFGSKNAVVLQVNPTFVRICPNCGHALRHLCGGTYQCTPRYAACCCSPAMSQQSPPD